MKYYLVSETNVERQDLYTLHNHTEHFLLKVENEIQYFDFDDDDYSNHYNKHELTELNENQFNCLKGTLKIREKLYP
jgi:hypothetical protein